MKNKSNTLTVVYLASFFYALHYAIILYIGSSFLGKFLSTESVGLMFTTAALVSIIILFNLPPILRRFGNYRLLISAVILEAATLFILATMPSRETVIFFFVVHQVLINIIYFSLTVFLESFSKDETTGGTRGIFLTVLNVAILAGPLIAGNVLGEDSYKNAFMISGLLALPILFLVGRHMRSFTDPEYTSISFIQTIGGIIREKSLRHIFIIQFLLQFFYGIMVIYTPIYLNTQMGIPMSDILKIIIPVALLPFVVFPYLIGNLADKKLGEKEMLFVGFLILGAATASLSFIQSHAVMVWAGALFITRIGATFIETMAESYFFKHTGASDTQIISFFRNTSSFSYLVSPVIASAFLSVFDYRFIFLGLGIIMLIGLRYSLLLKDTK
ncbi:MAG: MFS transporter [Candidatus Paceibacterota bacterium]|jgi:MFS family permease